jgi:hypothetical protein
VLILMQMRGCSILRRSIASFSVQAGLTGPEDAKHK